MNAGHQFRKCERLDQRVVGACLQASDAVFHLGASREHEHRRLARLAQGGQHGQTIDAGQHAVQNDEIVGLLRGQVQAVDAVVRGIDHKAFLAQAFLQVLGELGFVFDD